MNLESVPFRIFAAVSAALVLKMLALAYLTGAARMQKKRYVNPEDAKALKGETASAEHETVARIIRAHQNAIENEPLFILLGLLWVLMGAETQPLQIYAYTFLGARVLHSVSYVLKLQPWRSLAYGVGSLCLIGMGVQVLMAAFGG